MKKISNNGFTIVELLTSFTLASVVMILITNILFTIKENYIQSKLKTEAESEFALLVTALNEDAYACSYSSHKAGATGTNKYTIYFIDDSTCDLGAVALTLTPTEQGLLATYQRYDKADKSYKILSTEYYQFPEGTTFSNLSMAKKSLSGVSYGFLQFDINTTYPITGDTKTTTARILYK